MTADLGGLSPSRVEHHAPEYWDAQALEREQRRQFEVCHGCRLCHNLCPAFPRLFAYLDEAADGDVDRLTPAHLREVTALCYECKLCFVVCPYTPPHEFQIDIPRLVLRARAVYAREAPRRLGARLLAAPDLVGPLGCAAAPLANAAARQPLVRRVMEQTLGIHRQALLPRFAPFTFASWFARRRAPACATPIRKVALFYTCLVNYYHPEIGMAAVKTLERSGVEVICPPQRCCGMPALDEGQLEAALHHMARNVESLAAAVEAGYDIVVPEPTCGMMLRKEYPDYLHSEAAQRVARRTYDLAEYLLQLDRAGKLRKDFAYAPGKIAYHQPCHLKYQAIGRRSVELLQLIPGAEVVVVDRGCSGHDGTWAFKREYHPLSLEVGARLFAGLREAGAAILATDCSLAALQIEQGTGQRPVHPIEILWAAYADEEETA
ncbi:MAG TPA: anaerobic glycerol-3-phosphate dehydrogenase subunit C [Chloroflexota bacterium]|nr:anaerobic glycerol-3-phosphate dehydrogenase subunit C [Chloroflexota bacterium]